MPQVSNNSVHLVYLAIITIMVIVVVYIIARSHKARAELKKMEAGEPMRFIQSKKEGKTVVPIPLPYPELLRRVKKIARDEMSAMKKSFWGGSSDDSPDADGIEDSFQEKLSLSSMLFCGVLMALNIRCDDVSEMIASLCCSSLMSVLMVRKPEEEERAMVDYLPAAMKYLMQERNVSFGRQIDLFREENPGMDFAIPLISEFWQHDFEDVYYCAVSFAWIIGSGVGSDLQIARLLGYEIKTLADLSDRRGEIVGLIGFEVYKSEIERKVNGIKVLFSRLRMTRDAGIEGMMWTIVMRILSVNSVVEEARGGGTGVGRSPTTRQDGIGGPPREETTIAAEERTKQGVIAAEKQTKQGVIAAEERTKQGVIAAEKQTKQDAIAAEKQTKQDAIAAEKQTKQDAITAEKQTKQDAIAAEKQTKQDVIAAEERTKQGVIAAEERTKQGAIAAEKQTKQGAISAKE